MVTAALGAWLIGGLFIDGWAHNHQKPETIFTPWHAVLYSGFLASAAFALLLVKRNLRPTDRPSDGVQATQAGWAAVPVGHGLTILGVAIFGVGACSDLAWHSLFGIEVNLAALLSPTHLVMFCGAILVLTGPFRAAWADPSMRAPSLRQFLPALASLTLATALVAFFFQYATPFRRDEYGTWVGAFTAFVTRFPGAADNFREHLQIVGLAAVVITNVVYIAPILLVLRRWRPPFGTATILLGSVTFLVGSIDAFEHPWILAASLIGGMVADVLIAALRPSAARPWAVHATAVLTAGALWASFFALYQAVLGVGWEPELWAGSIVVAMISAAGLSVLAFPPAVPAAALD